MIIGLWGPKRAGKDTAATMYMQLARLEGLTYHQFALADWLKASFPQGDTETKEAYRKRLQVKGGYYAHINGEDWLAEEVLGRIHGKMLLEKTDAVSVITDVRRKAEALAIKRAGGYIVYVTAPEEIRRDRSDDPDQFVHDDQDPTEREALQPNAQDYDFALVNSGGFHRLMEQAAKSWGYMKKAETGAARATRVEGRNFRITHAPGCLMLDRLPDTRGSE